MQVIIRNSRTGEEYEIASFDFRRGRHYRDPKSGDMQTYEEAGFKIVSLPNGEPYEGPLNEPPAERGKAD
jgi:hypothetical protein